MEGTQGIQWKTGPNDIAYKGESRTYTVAELKVAAEQNRIAGVPEADNQFAIDVIAIESITPAFTPEQVLALERRGNLCFSSDVYKQAYTLHHQRLNREELKKQKFWTGLFVGVSTLSGAALLALVVISSKGVGKHLNKIENMRKY